MSGKTFRKITTALPQLEDNNDVSSAANRLDELNTLTVFTNSEGGKVLFDIKLKESSRLINELIIMSKTKHEHVALLRVIARLESALDLLTELNGAEKNADEQQKLIDNLIQESI